LACLNPVNEQPILHIIDSLTTGGAEILLKNTVNILKEFRHVVVYLNKPDPLIKEFKGDVEFICLHHQGWKKIPSTVLKLKKIIMHKKPQLVHSHLQISTICARLATNRSVPLLTTLHSTFSEDAFHKSRKSIWAEKLTLKKHHSLVGVSRHVVNDYLRLIPFRGKIFVLYNFIPDHFFNGIPFNDSTDHLKCIALGNLKEAKNYHYILDIFSKLKEQNISLDIYGEGRMRNDLQKRINSEGLAVKLCGQVKDPLSVFKEYDLFIQASMHEGFGLSVIEAMASGLPVYLSDIEVFHEITNDLAYFFLLTDSDEAAKLILQLKQNSEFRKQHVEQAYEYCRDNYSQKKYSNKLLEIYKNVTSQN